MWKNTKIYIGPPGTGKTSTLLDIVEKEMETVDPGRIAYVSFTRKAVNEAIKRACKKFQIAPGDLTYFKTSHAIAFNFTGLRREQVLGLKDYKIIGEHLGLDFTTGEWQDGTFGKANGDQYAFIDGYSRARCIDPEIVWDMINHDNLNWYEFLRYHETIREYKAERGKYDFADMLDLPQGTLNIDVLIIDEAQDLSTAQWRYLHKVFCHAKRVYIGGDDDQAVFEWSGADVEYFINMPGDRIVLDQSWRVPRAVHEIAEEVSSRIHHRTSKNYHSRDEEGLVDYWMSIDDIDMSEGSWLILGRNSYLLPAAANAIRAMGHNFTFKNRSAASKTDVKAILAWEKHRKGETLTKAEAALITEYTSNINDTRIWHEAFDKMDSEEIEYYVSLLRAGESLTKEPRITISTIHGAKGGEADNVVLLTDMAYNTFDAMSQNSDSEWRVWYVGITRARKALHIVQPRGRYYINL